MATLPDGLGIPIKRPRDFKCPICGAQESNGGCDDPRTCEALARLGEESPGEITYLLEHSSELLRAVMKALDSLSIGAAVTNGSGHLLFANETAHHILSACDGLELTPHGELCTSRGCSCPSLSELRKRAAGVVGPGTSRITTSTLVVQRPSGKRDLTLFLRCINGASSKVDSKASSALLLMWDPELSVQAAADEVRQLSGLTPKETCLASLLTEGKTLSECCNELSGAFLRDLLDRNKNFRRLVPHLGVDGYFRGSLNSRRIFRAVLTALDLLKTGLVVTDMAGRPLLINQMAEEILHACDGLAISSTGVLQLSVEGIPFPVDTMLSRCTFQPMSQESCGVTMSIRRPSGKRPLTVVVRRTTFLEREQSTQEPAALLFILDSERPVGAPTADLRQLYRLTPAESKVANFVMEGKAPDECCELLGIRPSTLRMHLRNLYSKTGTRRKSELVWLLFRNHGLASTGSDAGRGSPPRGHGDGPAASDGHATRT